MKKNTKRPASKKPSTRQRVNIELDQEEYQRIAAYAKADFRTLTDLIRVALDAYIKAHPIEK